MSAEAMLKVDKAFTSERTGFVFSFIEVSVVNALQRKTELTPESHVKLVPAAVRLCLGERADLPPGSRKNQQKVIHRKRRGVEGASSQTLNGSLFFCRG